MNGYDLTRNWYNYKFSNPDRVKHVHSDFYFYTIDLWNRLGKKEKFGLPTSVTMEALRIGSYNTYKKVLNDLIDFGFIKLISDSKNQYQSKVVALSNNDKACDKALDEAQVFALSNNDETLVEALDTIVKQSTITNYSLESAVRETDYEEKMQNDFLNYWTEILVKGKNKGKQKWEGEDTWELSKRLSTWFHRYPDKYTRTSVPKSQMTSAEKHDEKIKKKYFKNGFYEFEEIKKSDFDSFRHAVYFEHTVDLYFRK